MSNLINLNYSAYQYYQSVLPEFNKICSPLLDLGIPFFGYVKFLNDGRYLRINNNPELNKIYLSTIQNCGRFYTNKMSSNDLITRYSADKSKFDILPSDLTKLDKKKDPILFLLQDFNLSNILYTYKSGSDNSIESYSFAVNSSFTNAYQFYINNIQYIEHFIKYFHQAAKNITSENDKTKFAYFKQSFNFYNQSSEKVAEDKIHHFLTNTRIKKIEGNYKNKDIVLTSRELDCINYMLLGYSMKAVANILNLSPRTVESYIQNAKNKTGYTNKSDLLRAVAKNNIY